MQRALLVIVPILVLSSACGGSSKEGESADTSSLDDTADSGEDGGIVYPSAQRALLFTGHGGAEPEGNGWGRFEEIASHWSEKYGVQTDWTGVLASEPRDYRLVVFVGQGLSGGSNFDASTVARFLEALDLGTRILVVTEAGNCEAPVLEALLDDLGVSIGFSGAGAQEYRIESTTRMRDHQLTAGVKSLAFSDPCYVAPGDGQALAWYEERTLVAAERPGQGGDVVVVGDFEFFDDSGGMERADDLLFADRMVEVDPALAE